MDYTLEFDSERVTITTSGRVDVADIERLVRELVSDPRFTPGMPILADHSALETRGLMADGARRIGHIFVNFGNKIGRSPLAVVVANKLTYGLVRMASTFALRAPLNIKIFYSREDAETWLARQALPRAEGDG
jgi:hypothetical protein